MKNVELIIKIGNQSQGITLNTATPGLEHQLIQFVSKALQSQITLENSEEPKEQLLNEKKITAPVETEINYDIPRPAPLGNVTTYGMGDPFKGTSWGINK